MAMVFEAPSASYTPERCLQGKSLPSASSGEVSRVDLPYGVGDSISMWALMEEMQRRRVATIALMESCVKTILSENCVLRVSKVGG